MRVLHLDQKQKRGNEVTLYLLVGQQDYQERLDDLLVLKDLRVHRRNQIISGGLRSNCDLPKVDYLFKGLLTRLSMLVSLILMLSLEFLPLTPAATSREYTFSFTNADVLQELLSTCSIIGNVVSDLSTLCLQLRWQSIQSGLIHVHKDLSSEIAISHCGYEGGSVHLLSLPSWLRVLLSAHLLYKLSPHILRDVRQELCIYTEF